MCPQTLQSGAASEGRRLAGIEPPSRAETLLALLRTRTRNGVVVLRTREIARALGVSSRTIERAVNDLLSQGSLTMTNLRRGRWRVARLADPGVPPSGGAESQPIQLQLAAVEADGSGDGALDRSSVESAAKRRDGFTPLLPGVCDDCHSEARHRYGYAGLGLCRHCALRRFNISLTFAAQAAAASRRAS